MTINPPYNVVITTDKAITFITESISRLHLSRYAALIKDFIDVPDCLRMKITIVCQLLHGNIPIIKRAVMALSRASEMLT